VGTIREEGNESPGAPNASVIVGCLCHQLARLGWGEQIAVRENVRSVFIVISAFGKWWPSVLDLRRLFNRAGCPRAGSAIMRPETPDRQWGPAALVKGRKTVCDCRASLRFKQIVSAWFLDRLDLAISVPPVSRPLADKIGVIRIHASGKRSKVGRAAQNRNGAAQGVPASFF